jgi:HAD superfamily hydrolase (TIGR01509 family)
VNGTRFLHGRKTIIFDFGNTIAPFNAREADGVDGDLASFLARAAAVDERTCFALWREERAEDIRRSGTTGEEHDFRDRVRRVLARLGRAAGDSVAREAESQVIASFLRRVTVPEEIRAALRPLAARHRLGLLSNYLLVEPIRGVLGQCGIAELFAGVVVSKEVGFAKPHRMAFEAIFGALGVEPEEAVFVGDDWDADICGALACGLPAVWTWALCEKKPELPAVVPDRVEIIPTLEAYRTFLRFA